MIDLTAPQALINRANARATLRQRAHLARAVLTAALLCALIIAGYGMVLQTMAALPHIIAESAARAAG